MADLPDPLTLRETPMSVARIPSLDILSQRGWNSVLPTLSSEDKVSHKNALLSLLGYDLERGEPDIEELREYGLDGSASISDFPSLHPFVIPGFSGHGVCVTTSAWVRGVGKCALLKPLDIYSPGSSQEDVLEVLARLTIEAVKEQEFVLVYLDSPLKASLNGNYEGKVEALETIDQYLINPIADFVWKSDYMINLAITSDLTTPWHTQRPSLISVPYVIYFNNNDREGDSGHSFNEVESMLGQRFFENPGDLIKYLYSFSVTEEEYNDQ